jgi:outer membrane protein assembly factor BamB
MLLLFQSHESPVMKAFLGFLLLPLILGLQAGAENAECDWNEFRGPRGSGLAPGRSNPPIEWSEHHNIRWKTAIHGKGWSSPVICRKQIWLTTAPENGKQLFALCVDAGTGSIAHNIKVFDVASPEFCHPTNSYASCTPAIEPGRVYVHFGAYGTACLDTGTGKKIWERRDFPCDHFRGPGSSPVLWNDSLFVSYDGIDRQYVVALNKHTGKTLWTKARSTDYQTDNGDLKKAYSTPGVFTVNGQTQMISPGAVASIAYDPQSGDELWHVRHGGMNASARILFGLDHFFIATGDSPSALVAVPAAGLGRKTPSWIATKAIPRRASPILVDGLLYYAGDTGIFTCLDASGGNEVWQKRIGGNFWASPVHAGGRLYFCSQEGITTVLRVGREFKQLAQNKLDEGGNASPAVLDHSLILRSRTHLYRIEAAPSR